MNKKRVRYYIFALAIIALIAMVGCTSQNNLTGEVTSNQVNKVSLRLPIPFYDTSQLPFLTAEDNGFYAKQGLEVENILGSSELNPVKMVASGADEFGLLGGPDTLLVARSKGHPLVAIAVLHRKSNFPIIITKKDSGITTIKQLEGKKVGFFYGHISTDILRNTFRKKNVNVTEINIPGYNYNQFIAGKVDAQYGWRDLSPFTFEKEGIDINIIQPADYGIVSHGFTVFTTEDMIKNHPDIVEKYLRGTLEGVKYMIENPEKSVKESLVSRVANTDVETEIKRAYMIKDALSNSKEYPPGYMDLEMFQETYDRLKEEGVIENEFDVNDAFTTQFLDKIYS